MGKRTLMLFSRTNRNLHLSYSLLVITTVIVTFTKLYSLEPKINHFLRTSMVSQKHGLYKHDISERFVGRNSSTKTTLNFFEGNSRTSIDNLLTKTTKQNSCNQEFRRRHFIAVNQKGQTANQMFQFAVLIATAETVCYTAVRTAHYLPYIDHIFDMKNVVRLSKSNPDFREITPAAGSLYFNSSFVSHINPNYNWTIKGYLQSFKYFVNHAALVRSSFVFKNNVKKDVLRYLDEFESIPKVSIHIRRRDFLDRIRLERGYVVADVGYIERAVNHFNKTLKNEFVLIVVSDDMPWCRKNIKGNNIHFSPFKDGGQDLFLLTQCDHNIVSSGTFGWMGAWLNQTGTVVYDRRYPRPGSKLGEGYLEANYYPNDWIGL